MTRTTGKNRASNGQQTVTYTKLAQTFQKKGSDLSRRKATAPWDKESMRSHHMAWKLLNHPEVSFIYVPPVTM